MEWSIMWIKRTHAAGVQWHATTCSGVMRYRKRTPIRRQVTAGLPGSLIARGCGGPKFGLAVLSRGHHTNAVGAFISHELDMSRLG